MSASQSTAGTSPRLRALQIVVLVAFVATVWFAGPKAYRVLAARLAPDPARGPHVELDRVGFLAVPDWLDRSLLRSVATELSTVLTGEVALHDEAALRELRNRLTALPWVADASFQHSYPRGLRAEIVLRRPRLAVRIVRPGPDPENVATTALVDDAGVWLPPVQTLTPLPYVSLPTLDTPITFGAACTDPFVRAALGVALEWTQHVAPLLRAAPTLVAVDPANLGRRYIADPARAQISVGLATADGTTAWFDYDHPVDAADPRVEPTVRANIVEQILGEYPGLRGLRGGDLRFVNTWRKYLLPRP